MSTPPDPQRQRALQYLLGEMSEEERSAFREQLLSSEELMDIVREVEADLIDGLAADELPADRAAQVRTMLTATHQEHRLPTAVALTQAATGRPRRSRWGWVLLMAASMLIAAVGLYRFRQGQTPAPPSAANNNDRPATVEKLYAVNLQPGTLRSGERQMIEVEPPPGTDVLLCHLALRRQLTGTYVAEVSSPKRTQQIATTKTDDALELRLPLRDWTTGSYEVALLPVRNGIPVAEPADVYYFRLK